MKGPAWTPETYAMAHKAAFDMPMGANVPNPGGCKGFLQEALVEIDRLNKELMRLKPASAGFHDVDEFYKE